MSTRDEVIIKILEGLDLTLMLGKHRYCNILNRGWSDPGIASCVFEYDYPTNGDPSAHNWREHVALDAHAPPGHFGGPYPAPTWTIRPSQLAGLARPLPDSLPRTPPPSPGDYQGSGDETDKATVKSPFSASGSVKVEPPGHPTSSIKSEEPAYEPAQELRDEIARLRGALPQCIPTGAHRTTAYEPAQALRDEIARLHSSGPQAIVRVKEEQIPEYEHGAADLISPQSGEYGLEKTAVGLSDAQSLSVKQEPRDMQSETPAIGPSQALWNEWSRLWSQQQQRIGPVTLIKREPGGPQPTSQLLTVPQSPKATGSREHTSRVKEQLPSSERIKREPAAGESVQPWKRLKTEFN
ncbi:hypothetical protein BJY52DRAFT_1182321 [Lactarius psammicola]|nr:hypothetical protein BJY52DRAFT_1182321 [Lactarius psammicola]